MKKKLLTSEQTIRREASEKIFKELKETKTYLRVESKEKLEVLFKDTSEQLEGDINAIKQDSVIYYNPLFYSFKLNHLEEIKKYGYTEILI